MKMVSAWADGLLGQGGDVQPAQADVRALVPVVIGQLVSPVGGGDVDLDHHQVGVIVQSRGLDVFVLRMISSSFTQISSQGCQPQRREKRVLDRPQEWALGFGQGR